MPDRAPLCDPERLRALADSGLGPDPDAEMEHLAEWVRADVGVPVALVTLVRADEQVFPGLAGLPEPWASKRATPLSHSFCRHVVATGNPLVVVDARVDPRVRDNLAVPDLGVAAYAGMPLTDAEGRVLGSLCAIDVEPREWTEDELARLRRIARACSAELQLRLARVDAQREREHRDTVDRQRRADSEHTRTLLAASQAFLGTTTVDDVRARIGELTGGALRPAYVGLDLAGDGVLGAVLTDEARVVHFASRAEFDAAHPPVAQLVLRALGLHAVVVAPLPGPEGPLGTLVLGWDQPRTMSLAEIVAVTTIAGYAAQALVRARHLQHREEVVTEMQQAMLTRLPEVPGLALAARYQPADARENVGGDWYDVSRLPDPEGPGTGALVVSVGDVVGHTFQAAVVMGQVRSMLRQAAWDHPTGPPSAILSAFERASTGSGLGAAGSAVLGLLREGPAGSWSLDWTNAGHPPPVLVRPDGGTVLLEPHDRLFGWGPPVDRGDHSLELTPGCTVVLYTDGLVERRDADIDDGIAALRAHLAASRHLGLQELVDGTVARLGRETADDVVVFAVRL
ncbi:GAF domain-containing SpoIIE family protein phosphatase [Pseudonocardia sp. RS010]|uniref:GAF domain-containing SpoIIE family protein phosphatase n=1 Tax=Pseudonocardia sp. RS010 TaxID=3385979 RepID=UPI0039A2A3CC